MQRPVGSVGVEALLDCQKMRGRFDNYCGVKCKYRNLLIK